MFTRTNGVWSEQAYVKASNTTANHNFGWSVGLDGEILAVGAVADNSCALGINGDAVATQLGMLHGSSLCV